MPGFAKLRKLLGESFGDVGIFFGDVVGFSQIIGKIEKLGPGLRSGAGAGDDELPVAFAQRELGGAVVFDQVVARFG